MGNWGKALIIANPVAGRKRGSALEEVSDILRSGGLDPVVQFTARRGDAEEFARRAGEIKPDILFVAGGDGTVNEAVNGHAGSDIPLAILPVGTTNVLALEIGIPFDAGRAASRALVGTPHRVRLGRITVRGLSPRYFILMAGIGFDAKVVHGLNDEIKKYTGKAAYVISGLRAIAGWQGNPISAKAEGKSLDATTVIVQNGRKYAGDFNLAPEADIGKPGLHAIVFDGRSRIDLLWYVANIVIGRHLSLPTVQCIECMSIRVEGTAHIQIDGDYFGESPALIETAQETVNLLY